MPQAYFTSVAMATNIDGLRIKTKGLELNDRLQFSIKQSQPNITSLKHTSSGMIVSSWKILAQSDH